MPDEKRTLEETIQACRQAWEERGVDGPLASYLAGPAPTPEILADKSHGWVGFTNATLADLKFYVTDPGWYAYGWHDKDGWHEEIKRGPDMPVERYLNGQRVVTDPLWTGQAHTMRDWGYPHDGVNDGGNEWLGQPRDYGRVVCSLSDLPFYRQLYGYERRFDRSNSPYPRLQRELDAFRYSDLWLCTCLWTSQPAVRVTMPWCEIHGEKLGPNFKRHWDGGLIVPVRLERSAATKRWEWGFDKGAGDESRFGFTLESVFSWQPAEPAVKFKEFVKFAEPKGDIVGEYVMDVDAKVYRELVDRMNEEIRRKMMISGRSMGLLKGITD